MHVGEPEVPGDNDGWTLVQRTLAAAAAVLNRGGGASAEALEQGIRSRSMTRRFRRPCSIMLAWRLRFG